MTPWFPSSRSFEFLALRAFERVVVLGLGGEHRASGRLAVPRLVLYPGEVATRSSNSPVLVSRERVLSMLETEGRLRLETAV
jgi:hypothetical protein